MIPIQPVGWWHYLHRHRTPIPAHFHHYFYSSWEDALWDLLRHFDYPPGSIALLPEFFCGHVVINMQRHGLHCVWYPADKSFQTSPILFKQYLDRYQPQVVVVLHAVGITNRLWAAANDWLPALPSNALLIEDSVHRVVNPQEISLVHPRHVVIDSLRKVVPLPGSNLYGLSDIAQLRQTPSWKTVGYQVRVVGWWALFQLYLLFGNALTKSKTSSVASLWWNHLAEQAMLHGYDVIGTQFMAGQGWQVWRYLSQYINHDRIAQIKKTQVHYYQHLLQPIWSSSTVFPFHFDSDDAGKLRAFPVGLTLSTAAQIVAELRRKGILVRLELDDSPWSKHRKAIYLPLGPHLTLSQIETIALTLVRTIYNLAHAPQSAV